DMHGNVAEWLQETAPGSGARRLAAGGSWADLPQEARVGAVRRHPRWQRVFDVGFRVVCDNP
ncbi:MAG: formylglycine-generating enzyme family protein, partial [Armatimonadetes bacterium]|nr:formylglycine-generating enzyme family protein [Armatimonadota bacterium]